MAEPAGVHVLCFGALRDRLGAETLVAEPVATVADLWSVVTRTHPDLQGHPDGVRAARNLVYCGWDAAVEPGDEVAFMPPVAGGAVDEAAGPRVRTELVSGPIDVGALVAELRGGRNGAVVVFEGVVRAHSEGQPVLRLDYEAYPAMAERELARIAAQVAERHRLGGLTLVHRLGTVAVGEVSLAVVAAAPHRREAMEACTEAVEILKHDLPVWKREHHPGGAVWVDARELAGAAGPAPLTEPAAEPRSEPAVAVPSLSHVDAAGELHMVDVSQRPPTLREATAEAVVRFASAATLEALRAGSPKGDVLATARLAGIMGAKRTPELIPLCHPLPLTHLDVGIRVDPELPGLRITATARCVAATGVEMEALTAAGVAGLTVIDMLKSVDPWMVVDHLGLREKSGGRSGSVQRPG
jgi:cyclic pyranopterin phosphate synthase